MIDEKGRLFGKVNIVDLLIVIIILAAAAFLGYKLLGPQSTAANTQKVLVTLYCEETPNYVADQLEEGADWRTGDSKSAVTDVTGKVVEITREDYCSVTLNCEGEGVVGTHGVTIGGTLYGAGQSMSVYFNDCKLFLRVQSIEVIE